jgi:hypothetical protein
MGTGPGETGQAASPSQPGTAPVPPATLRAAVRRPADGDRALVLEAGGDNVIVVLADEGGDAGQIWDFIQRLAGWKTTWM